MLIMIPQEDEEEEDDEDIDSLVSFHRRTLASSSSSLHGSKVKYILTSFTARISLLKAL